MENIWYVSVQRGKLGKNWTDGCVRLEQEVLKFNETLDRHESSFLWNSNDCKVSVQWQEKFYESNVILIGKMRVVQGVHSNNPHKSLAVMLM